MLLKLMSVVFACLFVSVAQAQTFGAELQRIAKLRSVFGDSVVSAITNLPPAQYFEARDQALALAEKAGDNAFARDDARATLCAALAKHGQGCGDTIVADSSEALSAVSKAKEN